MAIGRPYMQLSVDGLKAKLSASPDSRLLLEEVQHELAFRTTPKAKRLEREVRVLLARAEAPVKAAKKAAKKSPTKAAKKSPTKAAKKSSTKVALASAAGAPQHGLLGTDLESRYVALRATFTAEAEILSRWGVTSLAPSPIRDAAFRYWRENLQSGGQHPLGLGREDLERDLEALKNEKRGT